MKKIISAVLVLSLLLGLNTVSTFAAEIDSEVATTLSDSDAILMASSVLNAPDPEDDILKSKETTANDVIPLYNANGAVVALYVSFEPTGYAVINNSSLNPTAIEFGDGKQQLIEDVLSADPNSHIIYNSPVEVYSADAQMNTAQLASTGNETAGLYYYFPDLAESNASAAMYLNQIKTSTNGGVSTCGDGDYGFIDLSDMPSGSFTPEVIIGARATTWAVMEDYDSYAQDHCGATAVTNMALYYANAGYSYLKVQDVDTTFALVYDIVGKGPKTSITAYAKEYFSDCGYNLTVTELGVASFTNIINAVKADHPSAVLLAEGIANWHWVVCVGYRQYASGSNYMQIVTGWDNSIDYFYCPNSGSLVSYVGEFSVTG